MNKELKLYCVYEDDSGHCHLILKEVYRSFDKALTRIEDSFEEHKDVDVYYEEMDDLLSHFSQGCLEGDEYFVVLASELGENV